MTNPSEFHDVLRSFSAAAIGHIRHEIQKGVPVPGETFEIPVRTSETTKSTEERQRLNWEILLDANRDRLMASPEYRRCDQLMREIPVIEKHLNKLVGFMGGLFQLSAEGCLFSFVAYLLAGKAVPEFEEAKFATAFDDLLIFFEKDQMDYEAWVPLENFEPPAAELLITGNSTVLTTPTEVFETIFPIEGLMFRFEKVVEWETVLRIYWSGPKTINEPAPMEEYEKVTKAAGQILTALRLLKAQGLRAGEFAIRPRRWSPISMTVRYSSDLLQGARPCPPKYVLQTTETATLRRICEQLASLDEKRFPSLALAVRRFNLGYDRHHPEDRLLDQMIAFEALYLMEINADDRSEKRFRLSLRVAQFIAEGDLQLSVYNNMKRAYDLRSEIVHGGEPKGSRQDKPESTLKSITAVTDDYLRKSLRQFLELSRNPETPRCLVDWEKLLFPAEECRSENIIDRSQ
jgi:hypothetical protein